VAAELSTFAPIAGVDGACTATKGGLRCTAIVLRSGALCLYSPVAGLTTHAKASLDALGPVAILLAPNHYHNKGLAEYAAAYPDARVVAADAAAPRLQQLTGCHPEGLDTLVPDLPDGAALLTPPGLKTGEVWLTLPTQNGPAWLVTDAFAGPQKPAERKSGAPQLLKTFPRYGLAGGPLYADWVMDQLTSAPPNRLVPCHGDIVGGADLADQLARLIAGLP